jgi:hypothetical protein
VIDADLAAVGARAVNVIVAGPAAADFFAVGASPANTTLAAPIA